MAATVSELGASKFDASGLASDTAAAAAQLRRARKDRQRAGRDATEGKLRAAYQRIRALEAQLAACQHEIGELNTCHAAAAQQAVVLAGAAHDDQVLQREVIERLALAAPVVITELGKVNEAGIGVPAELGWRSPPLGVAPSGGGASIPMATAGGAPSRLTRSRRNAGLHCATRRGASIARMSQRSLNRLQRGVRRRDSRPDRRGARRYSRTRPQGPFGAAMGAVVGKLEVVPSADSAAVRSLSGSVAALRAVAEAGCPPQQVLHLLERAPPTEPMDPLGCENEGKAPRCLPRTGRPQTPGPRGPAAGRRSPYLNPRGVAVVQQAADAAEGLDSPPGRPTVPSRTTMQSAAVRIQRRWAVYCNGGSLVLPPLPWARVRAFAAMREIMSEYEDGEDDVDTLVATGMEVVEEVLTAECFDEVARWLQLVVEDLIAC